MSSSFNWAPYIMASGSPEALVQLAARAGHSNVGSDKRNPLADVAQAGEVIAFWRAAGPQLWFAKDDNFDRRLRERFLRLHEAAARGDLRDWLGFPDGALALLILLDQFPRNAFRGSPRMYATDEMARKIAVAAISAGHDDAFEPELRLFFYLPFGHSEKLQDQRSVLH
jgi:uncharacterized protein (DUF924 family)